MLKVLGECYVTKSFTKQTANNFKITDLYLKFETSMCLDKASKVYRSDEIRAFIIGEHVDMPRFNSVIEITDSELRVNQWTDKETGKPRSAPEILIKDWKHK